VTEVQRRIEATPDAVFAVISDGWMFPTWVVGAVRIRAVEADFPAPGSRLHHSVGVWPLMIQDHTEVSACDPGKRLVLHARAWPAGEAVVDVELRPDGDGTIVVMREDAVAGPSRFVPRRLRAAGLVVRNTETLRRLAWLAERRTEPREDTE
jgi:uncharacterized protein YndB with AHSA1/START domain